MLNLQPYQNPTYFFILILFLLPIIIGLLFEKRCKLYEAVISFGFLWLTFGSTKWHEGLALLGYVVYQLCLIYGYQALKRRNNRTSSFVSAVVLAILPLFVVKVTPLISPDPSLIGFLGISYLTFKVVGMIMEIRDGLIKELKLTSVLHFLLFFPTISSGPIDRYRRFIQDYRKVPTRAQYLDLLNKGVFYIFLGFLYKFVLAYFFGTVLLPKIGHEALFQGGISWELVGYMYVYSMDLFFDFAGYSLFAVGTSYLMGVKTPINFNKPFSSPNIKEFWNRWHMTLSFWFRDYVYMRFVFFIMKNKLLKNKIVIANLGYVLLFLLMGFWHGLTWYYIVYGLYHAGAIIICDAWLRFKKKHQAKLPSNKFTQALAVLITFNVVCFSFLIFSGFLDKLLFR